MVRWTRQDVARRAALFFFLLPRGAGISSQSEVKSRDLESAFYLDCFYFAGRSTPTLAQVMHISPALPFLPSQ